MDTRTGQLYATREEAEAVARAAEDVVGVEPVAVAERSYVRVVSGPFKGRVYEVLDGRRGRRMKALE